MHLKSGSSEFKCGFFKNKKSESNYFYLEEDTEKSDNAYLWGLSATVMKRHHYNINKGGIAWSRGGGGGVYSIDSMALILSVLEQDYRAGLAIAQVELTAANIRDVDRRGFEINTPFKNFW